MEIVLDTAGATGDQAMTDTTKPKTASGGARMRKKGKRPMQLQLTASQHALLFDAARVAGLPATELVLRAALAEANKIMEKIGKIS